LTTDYTQITNYSFDQPYPRYTLPDAPITGTVKFIGLANEGSAPTLISTNLGKFVLQTPEQNNAELIYVDDHWKTLHGNLAWFADTQQALISSAGTQQGKYIALSADGNTIAIIGSNEVWVYYRSNNIWTMQLDYTQSGAQSVALSADGNTLAFGVLPGLDRGHTIIYTRSGSTWSEQVQLTSTITNQGGIVALSGNGNTLAAAYSPSIGHVIIYVRTGISWSVQASLPVDQAIGIALSGDGNTIALGANNNIYIYIRIGTTWSLQETITTVTGIILSTSLSNSGNVLAIGSESNNGIFIFKRNGLLSWDQTAFVNDTSFNINNNQGESVSLSGNGNTLACGSIGGELPLRFWVYTESEGIWSLQFKADLPSTFSVVISSDGNTLAVGDIFYNSNQGAVYVYT
jgi:hypothetical protein